MPRPHSFALAAIVLVLLLLSPPASAQERGGISGTVVDKKTNRAIPFATVTVVGAQKGALTDSEGKFLITGVPVGTYEVRAQFLGYAPASEAAVAVTAGKSVALRLALQEIVVQQEKTVEVVAERRLVDVRQGTTVRSVSAGEIRNLPVQSITDVLQQQAGIQTDGDQVHVRGGRADETLFLVQGVANRDLVTGQPTAGQLNARSVAEVNVATGAYDVRYGNALSGVVEVRLKEGGDRFAGGLTTTGETYGGRAMQLTLGGPFGFWPSNRGSMNWFVDFSTSHHATRFPNITEVPGEPVLHSSYEDAVFGQTWQYGSFFAPSEDNNWAARGAMSWKPSAAEKWNLDVSKRIAVDQGFSRTFINAAGDAGDPTYPWRWSRRIDHAPTILEDNVQASLKYRRTLGTTGFTEAQFSRYYSAFRRDVQGKHWSEYEPPDDLSLPPLVIPNPDYDPLLPEDPETNPKTLLANNPKRNDYFFDTGDDNTWQDRRTTTYALNWDITKKLKRHEVEFGFEHQWQSVQYVTIEDPWEPDPSGLGSTHDLWTVNPWIGTLFARDRLDFEGFSANIGLRADYWFVGREAEAALSSPADTINITPETRQEYYDGTHTFFGRRYKVRYSPRIIISHPIGTNSSFFFNYVKFTQNPSYRYVYSKLNSVSSESFPLLGNINLNPQVSINYEVGGRNQFATFAAANATFFVKDIYDYPVSTLFTRTQGANLVPVLIYLNGHYARSLGFEVEVEKRRGTGYWAGKVSYTYQQTRGKSSDPNEAKVAEQGEFSAAETRLSESFVRWNRPHKVSATFDLGFSDRTPRSFGWLKQARLGVYVQGQTGKAYTQVFAPDAPSQSSEPYSRNAPFQITTDLRLSKAFPFAGRRLEFGLAGLNVFGTRVINRVDAFTGQGRVWGVGQYDPNVFDVNEYTKEAEVDDPSNYGAPARWRVSLDFDF